MVALEADVSLLPEIGSASRQLVVVMDDLCLYCLWRRDLFYVSVLSLLTFHSYIGRNTQFYFLIFLRKKKSEIAEWDI